MPWLCHTTSKKKKKRSSKTRVSAVRRTEGDDAQQQHTLTNGRAMFAIVLQSFSASNADDLSIQRGQVVEVMYSDGDWSFVRNMDASSGFVPKTYCLGIDKVKGNFNSLSSSQVTGPLPQPRVINVDTLQRSGSSVNSVEVHQVSSNPATGVNATDGGSDPIDAPTSSQVIYEVPRTPMLGNRPITEGQATEMGVCSQRAPTLPPRSSNLPTPADIQWQRSQGSEGVQRPGYLPGCRQSTQNPFTMAMHTFHGTNQSPTQHSSLSHHRPSMLAQTPGSGHAPNHTHTTVVQTPGLCHAPNTPSQSAVGARASPQNPFSYHPMNSGHTSSPGFPTGLVHSAGSARTPGLRSSGVRGCPHHLPNVPAAAEFSPAIPGSAMALVLGPSPTSARVAMTPGPPSVPPAVTPGCATKPKFAATPSSIPGAETTSQWPRVAANSAPHYSQRVGSRRNNRRHSSDVMLLESSISEDTNAISFSPPFQGHGASSRHHIIDRRQSQPCIAAAMVDLHASPPRRPTRLPVRRTLSMQEPLPTDGRTPVVVTPSYMTPVLKAPLRRAPSYQEAVLSEEERLFGAAAGIKPSELIDAKVRGRGSTGERRRRTSSTRSASGSDLEPTTDGDDVFLPGTKKPYGIYQCVRQHQQKFKGEISLKKDELVIILDHGQGEWAWAITSDNTEGLIPKSVLVRYSSNFGVVVGGGGGGGGGGRTGTGNGTDAETQTDSDASCKDNGASCKDNGASCKDNGASCNENPTDSSCSSDATSSPSSAHHHHRKKQHTLSAVPVETNPNDGPSRPPKEWFDTIDSLDAANFIANASPPEPTPDYLTKSLEPSSKPLEPRAQFPLSSSSSQPLEKPSGSSASHGQPEVLPTPSSSSDKPADYVAPPSPFSQPLDSTNASPPASSRHNKPSTGTTTTTAITAAAADASGSSAKKTDAVPVNSKKPSGIPRRRRAASRQTPQEPATTTTTTTTSGGKRPPVALVKAGTVHYHDRISGMGSVNFDDPSTTAKAGSQRSPQTSSKSHIPQRSSSMLTAVKDYSPPPTSKNCLSLKKGDILHSQPHMHYPKGWMWVWHVRRRSFGYVPKNCISYAYNTPPRGKMRTDSVEDSV